MSPILRRVLVDTTLLVTVCWASVLVGGFVATYGRSDEAMISPIVVAGLAGCAVIVPSVILRNLVLHEGIRHLMSIAWRLPVAFACLLLMGNFEGEQRKCFVFAIMTCYFVTLTLESWLQIRQTKSK